VNPDQLELHRPGDVASVAASVAPLNGPTLGQLVAVMGRVVSLTESLLWRLTVLRLVADADETRFIESAAAEVDMAASDLADVEILRSELVGRLAIEAGAPGVALTLSAIATNAPEGVATALTAYRRRLNGLTAEIEATSAQIRKHIAVTMRHLDAVLGEARGTDTTTYAADGRTTAGPARPRLQRSL
jgi:hypothetical protein